MAAMRVTLAVAVLVVVVACRRERLDTFADSTDGATRVTLISTAPVRAWHVVAWEPYAGVDPADLGVGVTFLRRPEDKSAGPGVDTLLLRSAPRADATPLGAMIFTIDSVGGTHYSVAAADTLRPNLVEYGYEESGVPFDSADATSRWVRAILGFASDRTALVGWIDTSQPGVGLVRWAEQLADRPIFFPKPDRATLFATPDSATPITLPPGGDDAYALHPVERRGPWLRVRVVEPSDNCETDSIPRRTRTGWIRYLDPRGRPNVWYYSRGC